MRLISLMSGKAILGVITAGESALWGVSTSGESALRGSQHRLGVIIAGVSTPQESQQHYCTVGITRRLPALSFYFFVL